MVSSTTARVNFSRSISSASFTVAPLTSAASWSWVTGSSASRYSDQNSAVVDETMRLYPPAFLIARAAAARDTIAGMPVRKNDVVLIAPWLLHRHEKLWRDPNAFVPSRFMPPAPPPDR